eukprot:Clim_evm66s232 gene=Clim_evmTU66s232
MAPVFARAAVAALATNSTSSSFKYINKTSLGPGKIVVSSNLHQFFTTISEFPQFGEATMGLPWNGTDVVVPDFGSVELGITNNTMADCEGVTGTLETTLNNYPGTSLTSNVEFFKEDGQCFLRFASYQTTPEAGNGNNQFLELGYTTAFGSATGPNDSVAAISSCGQVSFLNNEGCPQVSYEKVNFALNIPFSGFTQFLNNGSLPGGEISFNTDSEGLYIKDSYPFTVDNATAIGTVGDGAQCSLTDQTITYTFDNDVGNIVAHVNYTNGLRGCEVSVERLDVNADAIRNNKDLTIVYTRTFPRGGPRGQPVLQISMCTVDWYLENNGCFAGQNQHDDVAGGFNVPKPLVPPSTTTAPTLGPTTSGPGSSDDGGLSGGAIAGIVIAVVVGFAILGVAAWLLYRRSSGANTNKNPTVGTNSNSIDEVRPTAPNYEVRPTGSVRAYH